MTTIHDPEVKATLQDMDAHRSWMSRYRTPENDAFYNLAFDYAARVYGPPGAGVVLDAGCGSSTKSIHLARRGYSVTAVDVAESILEAGRQEVARLGFTDRVTHRCEDLTAMSFADGVFSRVLCWGVLMHVPAVDRAIAEIARVSSPGAVIVISEGNLSSPEAVAGRWLKTLIGRPRAEVRRTDAGIEFWKETSSGRILTRQMRVEWLIRAFAAHNVNLVERRAGQLSELFILIGWKPARSLIHALNSLWFRRLRFPGPAFTNLLVFRKGGAAE